MSEINPEVFIRRQKLRRIFVSEFEAINKSIKAACKKADLKGSFYIRYSPHLLDRAIQREIDESYVFSLFNKIKDHVHEVMDYLEMPPLPEATNGKIDNIEQYRPLRLELTDGNLWLGMTVTPGKSEKPKDYNLCCRMAFVNNRRLKGKISTKIIYV